jgi:dynein heavy chain, axonemal
LPRTQHVAVYHLKADKVDKVFIFGGHHSPQARLNDTWLLDVKSMEWRRVGKEKDNTSNLESAVGAPGPRANMGATVYNDKVYIFGGHGGLNYARTAYNDLYSFDLISETWEKLVPANNPPDARGGHSVFASDNKVYIYGGWNAEMQYNNVWVFNLETKEWTDPDIYNEIPRWNHCSVLVEAIPTWKFFIFGGECAEYQEGNARSFGAYVNTSCILDLGTLRWNTFASDPETYENIPTPREYSAMTYDERDRRLIIYGGWNNGWFNDLYTLNVAKIVGPSYAITASDPALGQLSGNVKLKINGRGFKDVNIRVLFTLGNKPVDAPSK